MAQWNIPDETDQIVRNYLINTGSTEKDLSKFVDKAVRSKILRETIREIQTQNSDLGEEEAIKLANEAIAWARENRT